MLQQFGTGAVHSAQSEDHRRQGQQQQNNMFSTNMAQNQAYQQDATAQRPSQRETIVCKTTEITRVLNIISPSIFKQHHNSKIPTLRTIIHRLIVTKISMNFKPLPESKWNITFSGEEDRLELLDFLEKIDIFSSVERTRKNEVLRSAFHLFKGQAREWYNFFILITICSNNNAPTHK
jgi:hypothetical protein